MNDTVPPASGELLGTSRDYTANEALVICRIDKATFDDYIVQGVIDVEPVANLVISYRQICIISRAARLQVELDLSVHAVALMIQLLDRIDEQQSELSMLQQQ